MSGGFPKSVKVNSVQGFAKAQEEVVSGDSIIWISGVYSNMVIELNVDSVFFVSEIPGATTFSGSSTLKVTGNGNTVSGFQFVGGKIEGDVVDISASNNTIQHVNIQSYDSHYYLRIGPDCQHNIISYCNFESKPETQESSVVQVEASEKLIGYHVISHCSFKNHTAPPNAGGDFGIEALRIGYSYQRTFISRATVEYCYFKKCNGDYEIISAKACENVMRYNTFIDNGPAHLTLRHGSRNMVYGNFFINGAGVRIKEGQNHSVINNYFDNGEQMAIHLQNHHFDPVDTVKISNNTFITYSSLLLGNKGNYAPKHVSIANNLFSKKIDTLFSDPTGTESWHSNVIQNGNGNLVRDGFLAVSFDLEKNEDGFYVPDFDEKSLGSYKLKVPQILNIQDLDDDFLIELDIMKQDRKEEFDDIPGCFLPKGKVTLRWYATAKNTGPIYLR